MLVVMNHTISAAPAYNTTGMVGCPINAIRFRPGVISEFAISAIPHGEDGVRSAIVKVHSVLAKARS